MLHAVVSTPRNGMWTVIFRTLNGPSDSYSHIRTELPCQSYEHARAVEQAFNNPPTVEPNNG